MGAIKFDHSMIARKTESSLAVTMPLESMAYDFRWYACGARSASLGTSLAKAVLAIAVGYPLGSAGTVERRSSTLRACLPR